MNHFAAKLQAGNQLDFFAFVQDAGKDFFRLAKVAPRAKRRDNRANLLLRDANAYNPLPVVRGHSHNSESCFFVSLESLPKRNDGSAYDVRLMGFNRRPSRGLLDPPFPRFRWNHGAILLL